MSGPFSVVNSVVGMAAVRAAIYGQTRSILLLNTAPIVGIVIGLSVLVVTKFILPGISVVLGMVPTSAMTALVLIMLLALLVIVH